MKTLQTPAKTNLKQALTYRLILKKLCTAFLIILFPLTVLARPTPAFLQWLYAYAQASDVSPVLVFSIIQCESNFQQDVTPINKNGTKDTGLMQINSTHWAKARAMGYDVHTMLGNLQYGFYLLKTQGVKPWSASASCIGSYPIDNLIRYAFFYDYSSDTS